MKITKMACNNPNLNGKDVTVELDFEIDDSETITISFREDELKSFMDSVNYAYHIFMNFKG